ncbi:MAG TPA: mycofactocin biosynthesis chaperone MftB [Conexibacter sp.]|nr:mycofactocin biosynthesis chaperone MftB [Conexibacter sp.]
MSTDACDLDRAYRLGPQVAVRPEPFGALVYDFDSRRLSFLKSRTLLDVVRRLDASDSARDACRAAGVAERELPAYAAALDRLAATRLIVAREEAAA